MKILLVITTSFILALSGCVQSLETVRGSGHVVTIERTTETYDAIAVSGFYNIILVGGQVGRLTLEGEDNLLEYIKTEVKDGTLQIKPIEYLNFVPSHGEEIIITIPVDEINMIRLSGSGNLVGEKTLKTKDLDVQISGARNIDLTIDTEQATIATSGSSIIHLKGVSEALYLRSSGSSNIKAYDLEVDHANFELSGSSNVEVTVNESLSSRVAGSGNINYRGNPEKIDSKISGSGSVIKD